MASASIFLSLPGTCSVQGPYSSIYGVWFSCLRGFNSCTSIKHMESKAFCLVNSPPLIDYLDSLNHWHNIGSLFLFYCCFHADCSSHLATACLHSSCNLVAQGFLLLILILSIFLMQELIIPYIGKLWNCLPSSVFPFAYDLNSFKRLVSKHLSRWTILTVLSSLQGLATSRI